MYLNSIPYKQADLDPNLQYGLYGAGLGGLLGLGGGLLGKKKRPILGTLMGAGLGAGLGAGGKYVYDNYGKSQMPKEPEKPVISRAEGKGQESNTWNPERLPINAAGQAKFKHDSETGLGDRYDPGLASGGVDPKNQSKYKALYLQLKQNGLDYSPRDRDAGIVGKGLNLPSLGSAKEGPKFIDKYPTQPANEEEAKLRAEVRPDVLPYDDPRLAKTYLGSHKEHHIGPNLFNMGAVFSRPDADFGMAAPEKDINIARELYGREIGYTEHPSWLSPKQRLGGPTSGVMGKEVGPNSVSGPIGTSKSILPFPLGTSKSGSHKQEQNMYSNRALIKLAESDIDTATDIIVRSYNFGPIKVSFEKRAEPVPELSLWDQAKAVPGQAWDWGKGQLGSMAASEAGNQIGKYWDKNPWLQAGVYGAGAGGILGLGSGLLGKKKRPLSSLLTGAMLGAGAGAGGKYLYDNYLKEQPGGGGTTGGAANTAQTPAATPPKTPEEAKAIHEETQKDPLVRNILGNQDAEVNSSRVNSPAIKAEDAAKAQSAASMFGNVAGLGASPLGFGAAQLGQLGAAQAVSQRPDLMNPVTPATTNPDGKTVSGDPPVDKVIEPDTEQAATNMAAAGKGGILGLGGLIANRAVNRFGTNSSLGKFRNWANSEAFSGLSQNPNAAQLSELGQKVRDYGSTLPGGLKDKTNLRDILTHGIPEVKAQKALGARSEVPYQPEMLEQPHLRPTNELAAGSSYRWKRTPGINGGQGSALLEPHPPDYVGPAPLQPAQTEVPHLPGKAEVPYQSAQTAKPAVKARPGVSGQVIRDEVDALAKRPALTSGWKGTAALPVAGAAIGSGLHWLNKRDPFNQAVDFLHPGASRMMKQMLPPIPPPIAATPGSAPTTGSGLPGAVEEKYPGPPQIPGQPPAPLVPSVQKSGAFTPYLLSRLRQKKAGEQTINSATNNQSIASLGSGPSMAGPKLATEPKMNYMPTFTHSPTSLTRNISTQIDEPERQRQYMMQRISGWSNR